MTTNDDIIYRAFLNAERDRKIEVLTKQLQAVTAERDEIRRLVGSTQYARRNMQLDRGPKTITATARLLGASAFWLITFLLDNDVIACNEDGLFQPTETYQNRGLFISVPDEKQVGSTVPELLVTPLGRLWLFRNGCAGFLDCYISPRALLERVNPTSGEQSPLLSADNLQVP